MGAEREYRSKAAGFHIMIMISMGDCFFTLMSAMIGGFTGPDHIAAGIVSGIGFLGTCVIFRGDSRVNCITAAATIQTVAAVNMGIGAGHYFESVSASLLILLVLAVLPYLEKKIEGLISQKFILFNLLFPRIKGLSFRCS